MKRLADKRKDVGLKLDSLRGEQARLEGAFKESRGQEREKIGQALKERAAAIKELDLHLGQLRGWEEELEEMIDRAQGTRGERRD